MVNKDKSHVFLSKNSPVKIQKQINSALGLKDLKEGTVYLGNSLVMGIYKAKEFGRFKDKVQSRLEGWQAHILSRAGKGSLIWSVVEAIPVHSMSIFKILIGICKAMD